MQESPVEIKNGIIGWNDLDPKKFFFWNVTLNTAVRCIIYPSSLVKTRLQAQTQHNQYSGIRHAFSNILKTEGFRGLYKGFTVVMIGSTPTQYIYITSFEYFRELVRTKTPAGKTEVGASFIAGFIASLCSGFIQVPLDVVTQRLMIQDGKTHKTTYGGGIGITKTIMSTEGVRGMYRGYWISVATYAPYSAIWWAVYNFAKEKCQQLLPPDRFASEVSAHGLCGVISAISAAVCTNPLDVVKTRLQVADKETATVWSVARTLWQEEGLMALGKGGWARAMTMAPNSLLQIIAYEQVKKLSKKD